MRPTLERLFGEYNSCHRHPTNIAIHKVAIPVIVFHVLAMLDWVSLGFELSGHQITLAHAVFTLAALWYLYMSPKLALVMLPFSAFCLYLSSIASREVVIGAAVVAWTAQLIGHFRYEHRAPAFKDNLLQLLVGPVYFIALSLRWWTPPQHADSAR
tara:strand:+ start:417 stop:884 length:468 start_codon:yes stop_codon:yes gene_type:complete